MKYRLGATMGALALVMSVAQAGTTLATPRDKLSYALGAVTAKTFKAHGVQLTPSAFSLGFNDVMSGHKKQLSDKDIRQVVSNFEQENQEKMLKKVKAQGSSNQDQGAAFLAANKLKPGVVSTPSGLQYKVITPGSGKEPASSAVVTVNYEGTLISGKVFDSSYQRGQPATFSIKGVIAGWQEALPKMKSGATWMLYIPANLAYGSSDVPGIGPNQTLIFKVHLISIQ